MTDPFLTICWMDKCHPLKYMSITNLYASLNVRKIDIVNLWLNACYFYHDSPLFKFLLHLFNHSWNIEPYSALHYLTEPLRSQWIESGAILSSVTDWNTKIYYELLDHITRNLYLIGFGWKIHFIHLIFVRRKFERYSVNRQEDNRSVWKHLCSDCRTKVIQWGLFWSHLCHLPVFSSVWIFSKKPPWHQDSVGEGSLHVLSLLQYVEDYVGIACLFVLVPY